MIFFRMFILWLGMLITILLSSASLADTTLPGADDRDYWLPQQVNAPGILSAFQKTVSSKSDPYIGVSKPVNIALIYPSADVSDFWTRNYLALTRRLSELNIPHTTQEFSSKQIEHALQSNHTDTVLSKSDEFDYVIFGPSELEVQSENIQRLASSPDFKTFIWAFHTPKKKWQHTPKAWFDFSSSIGAKALCDFLIDHLGEDIMFAMNRGIPGITDDQRSQEFSDCVEENGYWLNIYEHFGQYQEKGGADGATLILKNFPEADVLHNANTAMAMGAVNTLEEANSIDRLFVTGWGGTAKELQKVKEGSLNATPMRMGDDVGVATAEAIKYILEERDNELPTVYLGRITVISRSMSDEEIDQLADEAFRYSGKPVIP
jgi:autoinducer 2-binding protein LuxP